jgi:hypothetical protein
MSFIIVPIKWKILPPVGFSCLRLSEEPKIRRFVKSSPDIPEEWKIRRFKESSSDIPEEWRIRRFKESFVYSYRTYPVKN